MLRTLRRRLVLSHVLPILLIVPLMGLAFAYVLERQFLVPTLVRELREQGAIVSVALEARPEVWENQEAAERFVDTVAGNVSARVMIFSADGNLLASSDRADSAALGSTLPVAGLDTALAGSEVSSDSYSPRLQSEIADLLLPVLGPDQRVLGVVRLTHQVNSVYDDFIRLRFVIASILALGVVLGAGVGWILAVSIERPLSRVTMAIRDFAQRERQTPFSVEGPAEVVALVDTYNELVARLHEVEESRRQLLANLVHEIGRPLGALLSATDALRGGADDDPTFRAELLAGMRGELHRLERLVADLSHVQSQLDSTFSLNKRSIPTTAWLMSALAPWREAALAKGLVWQTLVPVDLPSVEADPDRLAQALENLVSNAIKYTPPGGRITITASASADTLTMEVRDTGPGIPQAEQQRIFQPFYRGRAQGRFPQGMGLGLTIARDLAVAHGGSLEVASLARDGASFILRLPLPECPAA